MIIQDEMLRAAIARTLQIEEADITEKKLEELMTLSARSSGIISLEGLQYAVNLKYLDLCGNAIEDLIESGTQQGGQSGISGKCQEAEEAVCRN